MTELLAQVFTVTTLAVILTKTAPLLLAAIGGAVTQMSNVLNIGLEGMMLVGAFAAITVGSTAGSPWIGVLAAVASSMVLALVYSAATLVLRADFIVVGIGVNLLAAGVTVLLLQVLYGNPGVTPSDVTSRLPKLDLGPVGDLPVIGAAVDNQTAIVWLAFLSVAAYSHVLYRTRLGVALRAVGEDEAAAAAAGIDPRRIKFVAIMISGVMCGLAGAQLAMATLGSFTANMTSSRGFIAVAALTFGLARPTRTLIACLIFGSADAFADRLGIAGVNSSLSLMLPYLVTIAALVLAGLRVRAAVRAKARAAVARTSAMPAT